MNIRFSAVAGTPKHTCIFRIFVGSMVCSKIIHRSDMYKISILIACFLINSVSVKAQSVNQTVSIRAEEINEGYFIKRIPLQHYAVPDIRVTDAVYSAGEPAEAKVFDDKEIKVKLGKEFKKPFALLYIPAYKKGNSGKTEQLVSFKLSLQEKDKDEPLPNVQKTTAGSSVLATGTWYKIAVKQTGVYKIDYNFIKDKLNVNPANINPAHIRIYGNGGTMLSENNAVARYNDLQENAVQVVDNGNGSFDNNEYVLFYANGPDHWILNNGVFEFQKNIYSDSSYYFINFDLGAGKRIGGQSSSPVANVTVNSYDDRQVHEEDLVNIGRFGKEWWGEAFGTDAGLELTKTFTFDLGTLTDSALLKMQLGSRAGVSGNRFAVILNGQQIDNSTYNAVDLLKEEDYQISVRTISQKSLLPGGTNTVTIQYTSMGSGRGYLNYIEWNTRRELGLVNGMTVFRDVRSVGSGKVAGYQVKNANSNTVVWDITDALNPVKMNGSLSGSTYRFSRDANELHEFLAFDGSRFLTPVFREQVTNQDLHGKGQTDYLIVTHPDFSDAADKLANHHRVHDNMSVLVATTDQVYNEFSSGSQDISAIRDFAKYFYDNAGEDTAQMPKYLLLLGDASYDYKNRITNNTNYVPTFETAESSYGIFGYCSDDFFSMLDDNENSEDVTIANTMDIGVGRLPVGSAGEASKVADKIINYTTPASLGPWRLSTTIMTDWKPGEDYHFRDGEDMAATINAHSNLYNETKVHLAAIQRVSTPGGTRAPNANKMINDQIAKGTFLMNYSGHGSISTLSDARILTQDDFNSWTNINKLPIMVTATCEFSRFDNPEALSSGEQLMRKTDGGVIALLTTTQLVYPGENKQMNRQFLNALLSKQNGRWVTLGDAYRMGKNVTYIKPGYYDNFRKFALLGDPALTPAFPKYDVVTDSFLEGATLQRTDSMKALGYYILKGSVKDMDGSTLNTFNGNVYVRIYDKPRTERTIYGSLQTFEVQNNTIFIGRSTVTNGRFSIAFITPKDLNYDFGKGKISYYVENGTTDGVGADTNVVVGGFSAFPIVDKKGPEVKPYIGDSLFMDGGITGSNTSLFVKLYDEETGINVSGNAIGHDLTAVLDDDVANPYVLNDYYETAPNDYKHGYVNFPINGLSDGRHTFKVKAWDMNNNSGEGTVNFIVLNGKVVEVHNLINYPNPFTDVTHFVFDHNHPNEKMDVTIHIYTTTGSSVRTLRQSFTPSGSRSNEITWDGTSDRGTKLPSGLYVYRLTLSTEKGIKTSAYQKLILLR